MTKVEVDDPRDLLERIEGAEKIEKQIRVAEGALEKYLEDREIAEADRELKEISQRIESSEAIVLGAGGVLSAETLGRRVHVLEQEISALEKGVRSGPPGKIGAGGGTMGADDDEDTVRAPIVGDDEDGYGSGYGYGGGSGKGPAPGSGAGESGESGESGASAGAGECGEPRRLSVAGAGEDDEDGLRGGRFVGGYGDEGGEVLEPDRSRGLVSSAVDLLQIPVDGLPERIGPRIGQYLSAFTSEAYESAVFGARGELSVVRKGGGDPISFVSLEPEEMDLVDSALRFSLVEACVSQFKIPVLIDDPFLGFSLKKRMILSQVLGYMASATQVVLLTEKSDVSGHVLTW
jgi:hypothetical protein